MLGSARSRSQTTCGSAAEMRREGSSAGSGRRVAGWPDGSNLVTVTGSWRRDRPRAVEYQGSRSHRRSPDGASRGKILRMASSSGPAWRARLIGIAALFLAMSAHVPGAAAGASPQGGSETFDVYRPGVYSEQATWAWCTAASVQIIRNILFGGTDQRSAQQRQFFDYMRTSNRNPRVGQRGVDPQGFLAGLQHFVDPGYRLVASPTFDAAVRSAVTRLRLTGEPVVLIV